jgi:hypothetical protein
MKPRIGLFASVSLAIIYVILPARSACADSLCGDVNNRWGMLDVMGGEYRINNNIWGSNPGTQCLTLYPNSTYFSLITSTHNSGNVEAGPFIYKGCRWGNCTTASGLPIKVSELNTAPFTWSVDTNGATGVWNVAYDSWFSKTLANATANAAPDGLELMIWINYRGVNPGGSQIATTIINDYNWQVWYRSNSSPPDITYKITTPTNCIALDLKNFIDDAVNRGYLDTTWYLDDFEAGFELWQNGQGLTSKSFAGFVNETFSADFINFAAFAKHWLETDCDGANNWCNGSDYPPEDGIVNFEDLMAFTLDWIAE